MARESEKGQQQGRATSHMADIDVQDQPAEAGAGADDHAEVRRARASLEE